MTGLLKFSGVLEEICLTESWSKHRASRIQLKKCQKIIQKLLNWLYFIILFFKSMFFNKNLQGSGAEWPKLKLQLFVDDREPLFQA